MDAAEVERDVQLQLSSAQLIEEFGRSLPTFLWKTSAAGRTRLRRRVSTRETDRLIALLQPFQELPQLLDPHLEGFIPTLGNTLIEFLQSVSANTPHKPNAFLHPLREAISKLLYTFCKVRGEKVIVRFLSSETKHLELLLSAVENASASGDASESWSWEERYISMLWLSHLFLAPFDLASISSGSGHQNEEPAIERLAWPDRIPRIAVRAISLAVNYLTFAGKERDAAKVLLVRITMRKDMQEIGLLDALMNWALAALQPESVGGNDSTYRFVGILSYLTGVLASSITTSSMQEYLMRIFRTAESISNAENPVFTTIHTSAIARKTIIKIFRTLSVLALQDHEPTSPVFESATEIVESTIGNLLEALADNDTPVRLAASKSLSVITLKLQPEMGREVVQAVLAALEMNVQWNKTTSGTSVRDLSAVNPLEWHGLILTLSHLLYRRSPPPDTLGEILHALLIGLSFEQRSTSGTSVGTNVRDAACFGIWALARRYTTTELLSVSTPTVASASQYDSGTSIIQVLAVELMATASLDPAGNIRRGSSAALQELIGRHPDTVICGIPLVQVVDYHAVALRLRAVEKVGANAAQLSEIYFSGMLNGLLGWRGIGAPDAASRRVAAKGMEKLLQSSTELSWPRVLEVLRRMHENLKSLSTRDVDDRHGLTLCIAAALRVACSIPQKTDALKSALHALELSFPLLEAGKTASRRPELLAEGLCRTLESTCGVILSFPHAAVPVRTMIASTGTSLVLTYLARMEPEVISAATDALENLIQILDAEAGDMLISKLINGTLDVSTSRKGQSLGFVSALGVAYSIGSQQAQARILSAIRKRWELTPDIESKCAILQTMRHGAFFSTGFNDLIDIVGSGLDDYTSDARGDVGSLVRVEAAKTVNVALSTSWANVTPEVAASQWYGKLESFDVLYGLVLRLSAEKLDRVRNVARQTLAAFCRDPRRRESYTQLSTSSKEYFRFLLDLQTFDWLEIPYLEYTPSRWRLRLLEGYITSADTGSEDLIRASRAALVEFCMSSSQTASKPSIETLDFGDYANSIDFVCFGLVEIMRQNLSNDRLLIPAMETTGFLFDVGVMQRSTLAWPALFTLIQKSHLKSKNIRKLMAAVKLYGGLVGVVFPSDQSVDSSDVPNVLYAPALTKLTAMLLHPLPKIRNQAADALFVARGVGKGVDWSRASGAEGKEQVAQVRRAIGIAA